MFYNAFRYLVVLSVWHLGKHFYISFRDNTVDVIILSSCCMWQGPRGMRKWGGKGEKRVRQIYRAGADLSKWMTIERVAFTGLFLGASYCPIRLNTTTNCSAGSLVCFASEPCDQPEAWQLLVTGGYCSVEKSQTALGCPGGSYHTMVDAVFQNCL